MPEITIKTEDLRKSAEEITKLVNGAIESKEMNQESIEDIFETMNSDFISTISYLISKIDKNVIEELFDETLTLANSTINASEEFESLENQLLRSLQGEK